MLEASNAFPDQPAGQQQKGLDALAEIAEIMNSKDFLDQGIETLVGTRKRLITNPDNSITEAAWTVDTLLDEVIRISTDQEKGKLMYMAKDIVVAMKAQDDFFVKSEHPLINESRDISSFTLALLERILKTDGSIFYPYARVDESSYEADVLEIIRRTVLKPYYVIKEGPGDDIIWSIPSYDEYKDLWEAMGDRRKEIENQMKNPEDHEEFQRVKVEQAHNNPTQYTDAQWVEILKKEQLFYVEYIKARCLRSIGINQDVVNSLIVMGVGDKEGEKLLEEEISEIEAIKKLRTITISLDILKEIIKMKDFNELLPWIRKNFGENADYQTLLQKINPE